MKAKNLNLKGIRNIRDISQCSTIDGTKIKKGLLIRSARLDKLPQKRLNKFLNDNNISTIIDLRNDVEVSEGKKIVYPSNITYHHLSVLNKAYFGITHEKSMRSALFKESRRVKDKAYYSNFMVNMYISIIFEEYSQQQFKKFFDIILESKPGGIVFHCAGGKDRTGVAALFILTILGVSKEDILKDYSMSDVANKRHNSILTFLINILLFPVRRFGRLLKEMLHAKREYMEKTISAIEEKYGSVMNYLREVIDITEEKENRLKALFLEK